MFENLKLGLIILLTGIVVVFSVLVLLIGIIKLYSTIVYNVQNSVKNKKNKNEKNEQAEKESVSVQIPAKVETAETEKVSDGTVSGEIVAAIAAAIEVIFGQGSVKIKSIKKSSKRRSAWKSAGVAENTRSF